MTLTVFVVVPALDRDGPVRGAIALSKALSATLNVTLVSVKGGDMTVLTESDLRCFNFVDLGRYTRWSAKRRVFLEKMSSQRCKNIVISFCFSADVFSIFLKKHAIICSSVRANNFKNYKFSYGFSGYLLAVFHYRILRWFDRVYALDISMSDTIKKFSGCDPVVIGNFIDEDSAEIFRIKYVRDKLIKIVFVGSLTVRKQPLLFLSLIKKLVLSGYNVEGVIIGDGPLSALVNEYVLAEELGNSVRILGFLRNPLQEVSNADLFVLPSLSEGAPRAALEALFLGVPCVLRAIDGNTHLISAGVNGAIFSKDDDLFRSVVEAMHIVDTTAAGSTLRNNLLPIHNTRDFVVRRFLSDFISLIASCSSR